MNIQSVLAEMRPLIVSGVGDVSSFCGFTLSFEFY